MYLEKVEENCRRYVKTKIALRMALRGKRGRVEFSKFKCFGEKYGEEEEDHLGGFRKELMQRVICFYPSFFTLGVFFCDLRLAKFLWPLGLPTQESLFFQYTWATFFLI